MEFVCECTLRDRTVGVEQCRRKVVRSIRVLETSDSDGLKLEGTEVTSARANGTVITFVKLRAFAS